MINRREPRTRHILPDILRSDARRMSQYACASVLKSRANCTLVSGSIQRLEANLGACIV